MGLNSNHTVEEIGGYRCAVVEKNIKQERADFLTNLLSGNGYTVVCAPAAPPKAKAAAKPAEGAETTEAAAPAPEPSAPVAFDLGVTDVTFNPTNAIFGRLLKNALGKTVTPAYWAQQDSESRDDKPYFPVKY
jgi:hypothetical protein